MKFAASMLNREIRVFDQSVSAALVDLGNMIYKISSEALAGQGIKFKLTPSNLVRGINISVPTFGVPTLIVPLQFEGVGTIIVKLSVREQKLGVAAA